MKIILIANPTAGHRRRHDLDSAVAHLREKGAVVELWETRRRGDGRALAQQAVIQKPDVIVAAGGDGTINEVVNGMAYSGIPLGVLPLGTANVFALELGLPMNAVDAAGIVFNGRSDNIHLGRVNEHYFLQMAGVGFDAQVVYNLDLGLKKRLGKLAYVRTGVEALMHPPEDVLEIVVDGEALQGYGAIIGNGRYYGGTFKVTPLAGVDKPELDICIFTGRGAWSLARTMTAIALGLKPPASDAVYRKGKDITIRSDRPDPVQADGDIVARLPASFTVSENALNVMRS